MRALAPCLALLVGCEPPVPQARRPAHDRATPTDDAWDDGAPARDVAEAGQDVHTWLPDWEPPHDIRRVLIVGDSITHAGYFHEPGHVRYADLIVPELTARFGELEVLDVSHRGRTSFGLVAFDLPKIEAAWGRPVEGGTLVLGTVGTSDMKTLGFTEFIQEWFVDYLGLFAGAIGSPENFPDGSWFYLANIYDMTDGTAVYNDCWEGEERRWYLDAITEANANSLALAQDMGFAWVDARGHFDGHGQRFVDVTYPGHDGLDPTNWYFDCYHPNDRGQRELAELFLAAIDGVDMPVDP